MPQVALKPGAPVVPVRDDSGKPYGFVSNGVSILGQSAFNEIISIPLYSDPDAKPHPRPACKRGQIVVTAQIAFTVGALVYVLADIQVVGFVGSTGTVLQSGQLGGANPAMRVAFGEVDTFDRIAVIARLLQNGLPSSSIVNIQTAVVGAVVDMWE